ncbi:MAG TPA: mechanosensitive ion channel [Anaerolineales bacterium]|nr:mechanosensitive ion channel [Anaerolineales bacterium]
MEEYLNTFVDNFIKGIPNLLTALGIFIFSIYLARLASNLVRRVLRVRKAPEGVIHLLAQLLRWAILAVGAITALQRFFDVTAFLAGLGIVGFTVGFALQDVMKNFASGIILLLQQPFHVGEAIGVKDYDGTVLAINLRTTEIKTFDGRIVILPNAEVLANPIINYTRAERRRVDLPVRISYNADLSAARQAVLEAIQSVPGVVGEPAPVVGFSTFGDAALELNAFFWIDMKRTDPLTAKDEALTRIKIILAERGIEIPFPLQSLPARKRS